MGALLLSLNRGGGLSRGERQFRRRLESSSRFGAAFREAAERSLTLPKTGFGRRSPLWIIRQRSKRLFDAVVSGTAEEEAEAAAEGAAGAGTAGNGGFGDFPLLAEARRSCLRDEFDMEGFRDLVAALGNGTLGFSFFQSRGGSPFAAGLIWQETNALLYEGDERKDLRSPRARGRSPGPGDSLSGRIIAEALGDAALRPPIPAELAANFGARLRRELPGWAPEDARSLAEWVKERIAIPAGEWETLLKALPSPLLEELRADPDLGGRLRFLKRRGAAVESVVHREREEAWLGEDLPDRELRLWLRFQGPVSLSRIGEVFGAGTAEIESRISPPDGDLVYPVTIGRDRDSGERNLVCDAENLELLLRLKRAGARPEIAERPASLLVPFLALRQGLADGSRSSDTAEPSRAPEPSRAARAAGLGEWLGEWAAGLELPAELWETEIISARRNGYRSGELEEELREGRLLWYGAGKGRAGFCRPEDLDLVLPAGTDQDPRAAPPVPPFDRPDFFDTPRSYREIREAHGEAARDADRAVNRSADRDADRTLIPALWEQVWKGRLSSDSWEAPRQGAWKARVPRAEAVRLRPFTHRRIPKATRAVREGRKQVLPGRWFSLDREPVPEEALYRDELDRDRVRLLLSRWGVLCRPLLERESPVLSWARLLPTIRRMELAGELTAGRFFSGIDSLQFASPGIGRELEEAEALARRGTEAPLFAINAADPASPAALDIGGLDPRRPARSPRNRLYYRGQELVAVSLRNGRDLKIYIPPEESAGLAALVKAPRTRETNPEKKLVLETINGQAAAESPYGRLFTRAGFIADRGKLCLW